MAVMLITHDLGVVAGFARPRAVMYAGRIVEYGTTERRLRGSRPPVHAGADGSRAAARPTSAATGLASIPGALPSADAIPPGCRFEAALRDRRGRELCRTAPAARSTVRDATRLVACHYEADGARAGCDGTRRRGPLPR